MFCYSDHNYIHAQVYFILIYFISNTQSSCLYKFYSVMRIMQRRLSPLSMYSKALLISSKGTSWVINFSSSSSCHIWNNKEEKE